MFTNEPTEQQAANDDDENDDDDHELLMNKSEFLINENANLNTNSPNNGSADLMAIMMMTLNGDHLSMGGGGGASSSLATTALPTIFTPFYVTDNENFSYSTSQKSPSNKIKHFRGMNTKKYMAKNHKMNSKKLANKAELTNTLDEQTSLGNAK